MAAHRSTPYCQNRAREPPHARPSTTKLQSSSSLPSGAEKLSGIQARACRVYVNASRCDSGKQAPSSTKGERYFFVLFFVYEGGRVGVESEFRDAAAGILGCHGHPWSASGFSRHHYRCHACCSADDTTNRSRVVTCPGKRGSSHGLCTDDCIECVHKPCPWKPATNRHARIRTVYGDSIPRYAGSA